MMYLARIAGHILAAALLLALLLTLASSHSDAGVYPRRLALPDDPDTRAEVGRH